MSPFNWQQQPRKTSMRSEDRSEASKRRRIERLVQGHEIKAGKFLLAPIDYARQVVAHSRA